MLRLPLRNNYEITPKDRQEGSSQPVEEKDMKPFCPPPQ